jgi:transposase
MKPFRPHDRMRSIRLISLYLAGKSHRDIAAIYGGTKHGVRANLRRLRERGVIA